MAGRKEENPWYRSREGIQRELDLLVEEQALTAVMCERMARMETALAGGAGVRDESFLECVQLAHSTSKVIAACLAKARGMLEAQLRRLGSD